MLLTAIAVATEPDRADRDRVHDVQRPLQPGPRFASVDHVSGGRAGWNVVTTAAPRRRATSGSTSAAHGERYPGRTSSAGGNSDARLNGVDKLPGETNYFRGPQEQWITHVATYQRVIAEHINPGVECGDDGCDVSL